ncbi:MFS transporter [Thermogymnomonas acidicola]|uniref:MFS transporter n=1 Tax=Thermogymnomonas acidicola TaxID=399579 RepID=UPI001494DB6D|nr:MFS transporter [Thermogymnomonas acidicola]
MVGALFGGLMTDRLGRRTMLIYNLLVFVVMAALQALSTSAVEFTAFRAVMGFGLGADVATGFTYIYEFISTAQRKEVYPLWAYAFSMTALLAVGLVLLLIHVAGYGPNTWRYPVAVGAAAALVVLIFRSRIPETPFWLARTAGTGRLTRY